MKSILVLAAYLALAQGNGIFAYQQVAEHQIPIKSAEAEIYEAVISYQIKSWELAADSYCIKINGRDADKAILDRLQSSRVKQWSACREQVEKPSEFMSVIDKKSEKHSVIFDLEAIRLIEETSAEIEGGYLCGSLCMAGGVYRAVHDQSGWHVISFKVHVIS